ncbi:MAG: alkaline phosphatase family protein [Thermodesulfobacteriota bacterium]
MMNRLFICYISSFDLRRINNRYTPFIAGSFDSYQRVKINTIPDPDLEPTIFTGVYPHEHGMWQVKLKSEKEYSDKKLADNLPDILTTTGQCLIHLFTGSFDLAAVPSWRRRRLEINKTRYISRTLKNYLKFNNTASFFSIVGEKEGSYMYNIKFDKLHSLLPNLCSSGCRLEFLEIHSLDILQHWNLDNVSKISEFYRTTDHFLRELQIKCKKEEASLMILTDHGQEPVIGSIDLIKKLRRLSIAKDEYTYYIEVPRARFWFRTDRAREKIVDMLSSIENGTLLSYKDMYKFNVNFEDERYGEFYLIADPGYIFFPNDFYHPLGNIFLGLMDWQQRSRLTSPKHRGYHGYLPHNESENGFMMLLDNSYYAIKNEADIIDFAPTVLGLLGYERPDYMKGQCIFTK